MREHPGESESATCPQPLAVPCVLQVCGGFDAVKKQCNTVKGCIAFVVKTEKGTDFVSARTGVCA